jgi:hypothetical protein
MPDPRHKIPVEETKELVAGTKAGDSLSMERLIATRLRWLYDFAAREDLQTRHDLELADIMQIGCLAVIDVAQTISLDKKVDISTRFHIDVKLRAENIIMRSKLVPSVGSYGKTVYRPGSVPAEEVLRDPAEATDLGTLGKYIERSSDIGAELPESVENEVMDAAEPDHELIDLLLSFLKDRNSLVVSMYRGLTGITSEDVGKRFGISGERVRQITDSSINKLWRFYSLSYQLLRQRQVFPKDLTNKGLVPDREGLITERLKAKIANLQKES